MGNCIIFFGIKVQYPSDAWKLLVRVKMKRANHISILMTSQDMDLSIISTPTTSQDKDLGKKEKFPYVALCSSLARGIAIYYHH